MDFEQERMNEPWHPPKPKKRFIIEHRYIGTSELVSRLFNREWETYRKYRTERAQREALSALARRKTSFRAYQRNWEYRIP